MTNYNVVPTQERVPEQGKVVITIAPSGTPTELKRIGNLWFFPDDSMYVYYTPVAWIEEKS